MSAEPAPRCSQCGATTRPVENPFFGFGLSVHEVVYECNQCRLPTFTPRRVERPTGQESGPSRRRGFRGLFGHRD